MIFQIAAILAYFTIFSVAKVERTRNNWEVQYSIAVIGAPTWHSTSQNYVFKNKTYVNLSLRKWGITNRAATKAPSIDIMEIYMVLTFGWQASEKYNGGTKLPKINPLNHNPQICRQWKFCSGNKKRLYALR